MAAAYVLDATFNAVQLEFEERLLGRPLYVPAGEFAIFAIVHAGLSSAEDENLGTFRLVAATPYVFGGGENVVAEDTTTVAFHPSMGERESAEETVSLTVAAAFPLGGLVSVHGLGINTSVDAVKITALLLDSLHVTTYHEQPKPPPHPR
jgi:hypothetical protein